MALQLRQLTVGDLGPGLGFLGHCAAWFVSTVCRACIMAVFNVLHLLSDPMGLLNELVHYISLILQNHLQLWWLLELLYHLLEDMFLCWRYTFPPLWYSLFSCLLFSATTLAGRFPNANCLSCTAFTCCCWPRSLALITCSRSCWSPSSNIASCRSKSKTIGVEGE